MGQKVHPTGARLGIIKDWSSKWYADDKNFADYLVEDQKIRKYLKKKEYEANDRFYKISLDNVIGYQKEEIDTKIKLEKLRVILSGCLDEREKKIIEMRYGLYGGEELTQRDIAKKLGISRSYVSRIEKSALEKLRRQF